MKVHLESTTKIVELQMPNGSITPARIWEGQTDNGIRVHAYIALIAAKENEDLSQFEKELKEQRKPSVEVQMIPLRMIV